MSRLKRRQDRGVPFLYYILLFTAFFSITSCDDPILSEDDLLGGGNTIGIGVLDTLNVVTQNFDDEIITGKDLSVSLLVNTDDVAFGRTTSGFATELILPTNNLNLGSNLVIDSVVLSLDYFGVYGSNSKAVDVVVYELDEALNATDYNNNTVFGVKTPVLGTATDVMYNNVDSVSTAEGTNPPQLRIKLDNQFGQRLLDQSGTANYLDNAAFQNYFNGLYVTTNQGKTGNGAAYFDLLNSLSNLTLYYRNDSATRNIFTFPINSASTRVNTYNHDVSGSLSAQFSDTSNASGDSLLFVKGMSGTRAKIYIEGLENLDSLAINRAELVLTQVIDINNFEDIYEPPTELILFRIDDNGNSVVLLDLSSELSGHFGGEVEPAESGNGLVQYKFNISRYAQRVMRGDINNNGLYLNIVSGNVIADRIILGGSNHSESGIQFKLFYTKI